jgi:hypothetical protein
MHGIGSIVPEQQSHRASSRSQPVAATHHQRVSRQPAQCAVYIGLGSPGHAVLTELAWCDRLAKASMTGGGRSHLQLHSNSSSECKSGHSTAV